MAHPFGGRLGNYRLIRLLGRGGFAKVYLGEQIYLHTQAALKVLHTQLTEKQTQAFLQEARLLAHLSHSHIVPVLDFAVQEGIPFLVLQYAPRGSVRQIYPKGSCLPLATIVSYVKQVASALQFAHNQHLVHRDIKPENMLLGPHDAILLSDFGLAIIAQTAQQVLQNVVGTLPYMAPEQLQGIPCYASDQYALGVVVYEWLCGSPPFTGSAPEIMTQHMTAVPASLCERIVDLSEAVEQVIFRALSKEPQQRFDTITTFAEVLEQAWQASGSLAVDPHKPSLATSLSLLPDTHSLRQQSLVEREQEQAWLHHLLLETEQQITASRVAGQAPSLQPSWSRPVRACCALLAGEAGIGKTRLAEELGHVALQRGWHVLWSRGYEQESSLPYRFWTEILRNALQSGLWSPHTAGTSSHLTRSLALLLPGLTASQASSGEEAMREAEQESIQVPDAVFSVLTAICERTPLLVVLDDVHWADERSRDLIGYLARRLSSYPVLLLGTYRDHELTKDHPLSALMTALQRERVMTTRTLTALSDDAIGMLVSHLPEPLVQSIQQRAAGNPLFAEELARLFSEEDVGTGRDKTGTDARRRPSFLTTLGAVLDERLRRLSPLCQQVLQHVAILQSSFSLMTLQLMESGTQQGLSEDSLLSSLEEAVLVGILVEEGTDTAIHYRFRHPLFLDYLYESLTVARRTLLHQRAARVLQQVYAARVDEGAAAITFHLLAGGAGQHHLSFYAERAAHHAYALCAYTDAEHYYRIALAQLEVPLIDEEDARSTLPLQVDNAVHQAFLLEYLGECLHVQGKYHEACDVYTRALMLHQQHEGVAESHEEESAVQALLWGEVGFTWYDRGMFTHAWQCYEQGVQLLRRTGNAWRVVRATLCYQQGYVRWQEGRYVEAQALAQEALALFHGTLQKRGSRLIFPTLPTRLRRTLAGDPVNLGRTHMLLGMIANAVGHPTEAITQMSTALALFEQQGNQRELAIVCANLGDVYLRKADHNRTQTLFEQALSLAKRVGDVPSESIGCHNLGFLAARMGKLPEAEAWCKKGLLLAEGVNDLFTMSMLHTLLALVLHEQGKNDEGRESLQGAYALNQSLHVPLCAGFTEIVNGHVQLAQTLLEETMLPGKDRLHVSHFSQQGQQRLHAIKTMLREVEILEGLETEMRIDAQLLLARITFLIGDQDSVLQHVKQILDDAEQAALTWLEIRAHRLLGSLLMADDQHQVAQHHFEQAAQQCQRSKMGLEYARTLQEWGDALLRWKGAEEIAVQNGWRYLQKARSVLLECHAFLDLQYLEHLLVVHTDTVAG